MYLINQCQQSQISCTCYSILLAYALIIIVISGKALKLLIQTQASSIELSPMFFCLLQSILHVIQYAITENNKLQIFTLYIQILTFTSISVLFAEICYEGKSKGVPFRKRSTLKCLQVFFYGTIFILQLVTLMLTSSDECDTFYYIGIILIMLQQSVSTMVANYFGYLLLQRLKKVSKYIQFKTVNPNAVYDSSAKMSMAGHRVTVIEPRQLTDGRKQIKTVLIQMDITIALYIMLMVVVNTKFNEITCKHTNWQNHEEDVILLLYGIIEMTPCLIIPYAFGYIPQVDVQTIDGQDVIDLDRSKSLIEDQYLYM